MGYQQILPGQALHCSGVKVNEQVSFCQRQYFLQS